MATEEDLIYWLTFSTIFWIAFGSWIEVMRGFILDFRLSQDTLYWHTGRFSFGTTVRVTEFTLLTPSKFAFCSPWTGGHANLKCFAKLGMIQFKSISLIAEFGSQDWAHVFVLNLLFLALLYHSTLSCLLSISFLTLAFPTVYSITFHPFCPQAPTHFSSSSV